MFDSKHTMVLVVLTAYRASEAPKSPSLALMKKGGCKLSNDQARVQVTFFKDFHCLQDPASHTIDRNRGKSSTVYQSTCQGGEVEQTIAQSPREGTASIIAVS